MKLNIIISPFDSSTVKKIVKSDKYMFTTIGQNYFDNILQTKEIKNLKLGKGWLSEDNPFYTACEKHTMFKSNESKKIDVITMKVMDEIINVKLSMILKLLG